MITGRKVNRAIKILLMSRIHDKQAFFHFSSQKSKSSDFDDFFGSLLEIDIALILLK